MFKRTMQRTIPVFFILMISLAYSAPLTSAQAQTADINWNSPINISRSPEDASGDPFVIADRTGRVHLFWAEKTTPSPTRNPDTLMYSAWNGNFWSEPVDLFISPLSDGTPVLSFPRAVIDDFGRIHLIWIAQPNFPNYTVFYSSAPVEDAASASAWQPKVAIASDATGTKYSADLAIDQHGVLHMLYARVRQGDPPPEQRAVAYSRSTDYGRSWTDPQDIYTIPDIGRGASDTRLLVSAPDNLYASWTEWDNSGNGQAIYFARSQDGGKNWTQPRMITERKGNEYERDWNNLFLLPDSTLVAMWEGGMRAYRHAMYSDDGGQTWSEPIDTFPWLIGENGSVEFIQDSSGTVHLFYAQRIREGNDNRVGDIGLWHSVWQGGRNWSEPTLAGGIIPMVNPKVALASGNKLVAAWYSNEDNEVRVMTGKILDAPWVEPTPYETLAEFEAITETPTPEAVFTQTQDVAETQMPTLSGLPDVSKRPSTNAGAMVIWGVLGSGLIIGAIVIFSIINRRTG